MKTAKVRILKEIYQPGIGTWKLGDVVELTKRDAAYLVKNGAAEYHESGSEKKPVFKLDRQEAEKRLAKEGRGPRLSKTGNGKPVIALEEEGLYLDIDRDTRNWFFTVRDFRDPLSPHTTYTTRLDTPQKLITSKFAKPIREAIQTLYEDLYPTLSRIIQLIQQNEDLFEVQEDEGEDEDTVTEENMAEVILRLAEEHGLQLFRDQFTDPCTYLKTAQGQKLGKKMTLNVKFNNQEGLENNPILENGQEKHLDITDTTILSVTLPNTRTHKNKNEIVCVSVGGNNNKGASVGSVGDAGSVIDVWQVHRLRSRYVSDFLSGLLYRKMGKAAGKDKMNSAINVLAGQAQGRPQIPLWNRVAPDGEGGLWLDMSSDQWEAIHVTREGWEVVSRPPILFRRYPHQNPMIRPAMGGNLASLLDFCNLSSVDDQLLFLVIAVHYLVPGFPHIGVCLWGTHGSVKSTQQRLVKALIDPSSVGLLSMPGPKDIAELIQQLDHHYLPFYDNVTTINNDQSDTLCRAITGIGHQKRALYTDDDTYSRQFRRCVSLNGINVPTSNPDFLNRFVVLECPHLPEAYRRPEKELEAMFNEKAPLILGAMLDTVVKALNVYPDIEEKVGAVPRMADATLWCCAIAEALGLGWQSFLNAYRVNIGEVEESTVRSSPIGEPLLAFLEVVLRTQETVTVTATQLLTHLKQYAEAEGQNLKTGNFPPDGTRLSKELNKIKANLPKLGYHLRDKRESDGTRKKVFTRIKSTKLTEDYTPTQSHQNIWRAEDLRHILDPESYRRDGSRTRDGERDLEISEPEWLPTRDTDVEQPADPGSSESETPPEIQDSRSIPDIPESSEGETLGPDDVEESKPAQAVLGDTVEPDDPRMVEIVAYIAKNGGKYTADQIAYRWGGIPRPIFDRMLARAREVGLVYVDTEGRWFGK